MRRRRRRASASAPPSTSRASTPPTWATRAEAFIAAWKDGRGERQLIVVFGSVNVDFVTRVPRIPRPGETVLGPGYEVIPGGKGANQALARRAGQARRWRSSARSGHDPFADIGLSLLEADGRRLRSRRRACEAPTGAAFISVDDAGENAIVVASGANAASRAGQLDGVPSPRATRCCCSARCRRRKPSGRPARQAAGARVVLNAAPAGAVSPDLLGALDVLVVNEHEVAVVGEALGIAGRARRRRARHRRPARRRHGGDAGRATARRLDRRRPAARAGAAGHPRRHDGGRRHLLRRLRGGARRRASASPSRWPAAPPPAASPAPSGARSRACPGGDAIDEAAAGFAA